VLHESADVVQRLHASIILAPGTSAVTAVIVTQQELFVEHRAALCQPHANVAHTEPRHIHVSKALAISLECSHFALQEAFYKEGYNWKKKMLSEAIIHVSLG
jgi:hypothetical protein